MIKFRYRYCKVRMAAYINGDLSEGARRRIARYIDECPDCYNEYIRQRKLVNELERKLPAFGRPDAPQLDRMWSAIQGELAFASSDTNNNHMSHSSRRSQSYTTWSYGLLALAIFLLLLLPLAMSYQASVAIVPSPPQPQISELVKTPTTVANHVILASITQASVPLNSPLLQNTPAPASGRE